MVFSSVVFMFLFLPLCLLIYYILPRKMRNIFLLLMSLFFYAWGEPVNVLIMMFSILMNYTFALLIHRIQTRKQDENEATRAGKPIIVLTVLANLGIFFYFKYLNFTVYNINSLFGTNITLGKEILLPIGISFFTFQAMSYVFDVYRKNGEVQKNPLNVGLYVSLFPQLIAGPIVRYQTVADELRHRKETLSDFSNGIYRFVFGLGKKVLLANTLALIADHSFQLVGTLDLTPILAWMGVLAYALQIYFDFSGYSDMAIGLGLMFGFHFLENFNYPYISKNITDFWRRWHISLGSWFRDYVYIPLGGSRVKTGRLILNLLTVWLLTGVWHGANWTFVAWGLLFFVFLTFEKLLKIPQIKNCAFRIFYRVFTLLIVLLGWVLFRSDSIQQALQYIQTMFSFAQPVLPSDLFHLERNYLLLIVGALCSMPLLPAFKKHLEKVFPRGTKIIIDIFKIIFMVAILILSIAYVVSSNYNPFIYFNF